MNVPAAMSPPVSSSDHRRNSIGNAMIASTITAGVTFEVTASASSNPDTATQSQRRRSTPFTHRHAAYIAATAKNIMTGSSRAVRSILVATPDPGSAQAMPLARGVSHQSAAVISAAQNPTDRRNHRKKTSPMPNEAVAAT